MREDYQVYFEQVRLGLAAFNSEVLSEKDLSAEFSLLNGWIFVMDCERYYGPAFTMSLFHEDYGSFAVRTLMKVFYKKKGIDYGRPTIENQIHFLLSEKSTLFFDPQYYKEMYDVLDLNPAHPNVLD